MCHRSEGWTPVLGTVSILPDMVATAEMGRYRWVRRVQTSTPVPDCTLLITYPRMSYMCARYTYGTQGYAGTRRLRGRSAKHRGSIHY
jgi:hypothetical protein